MSDTQPDLFAPYQFELDLAPPATFEVTVTWGHLDRLPKCEHGRIPGYCRCWDDAPPQLTGIDHATRMRDEAWRDLAATRDEYGDDAGELSLTRMARWQRELFVLRRAPQPPDVTVEARPFRRGQTITIDGTHYRVNGSCWQTDGTAEVALCVEPGTWWVTRLAPTTTGWAHHSGPVDIQGGHH